jgi:hypothetical protein
MKLVASLALLLALGALTVPAAAEEKPDPKAEALRGLMAKFEGKLVTLTWFTKTSAMGQEIESPGAATGIMVGDKGLIAVSAQPFNNPMGGLAGMFGGRGGRGGGTQSSGPEGFKVAQGKTTVEALNVNEDSECNLRFFAGKFEEGKVTRSTRLARESRQCPRSAKKWSFSALTMPRSTTRASSRRRASTA